MCRSSLPAPEDVTSNKAETCYPDGQRWTVSDFDTKKSVIKAGHGWGGIPEHMIGAELDSGELIALNVEGFPPRHTEIFAIRRRDQTMGRVMSDIWAALQGSE